MTSTAVYRFHGASGDLLYVGITLNPTSRFRRHRRGNWWAEVATITIENHPDRASAALAEIAAIKAEKPRYNIQHTQPVDLPTCCRSLQPWDCPAMWPGRCTLADDHHHCLGQAGHYESEAVGCGTVGCPENGHCASGHFCRCGSPARPAGYALLVEP